ncbi:signal recognition particle protein [Paenibacillus dendritiformis]|jgi:signal recognition particle subunit SRP54|uniref:Signal recognition particle protein n=1 Tax=Paenibacillus dendritiformis C454 TaxID=1131935 RepID=H3SF36_9BACL|nr:signal recognition particle protein [Paenibacillus dendritiformis]EHQ62355.1 signal recognition particle protein [Paenibacillus dendritiformis C454]PZM66608.1 signal recognition particle protein [Paenibacillus dendritiformis]TDL55892.1 signal recognition particle protein [Paenibacillus dendritiformis]WGU96844.1 signal recognition particle protein [Paenibacillus dendritiformis]CAH8769967.1 signal recognition particle protein [Paenibacillus dendritiformis]
MAFEGLTSRLQNVFGKLRGKGKVTEDDVNEAMREVRLALLEADVNFKVVKEFINKVKEKAVGQEVMKSFTPGMVIVDIVNKELTELMGGTAAKLAKANKPPTVIMMAGLQGAGKTTTSGKLAKLLQKQNHKPLLVAADIYRPAAIKQLEVLGAQINVPVFSLGDQVSPVEIARQAMEHARANHLDYVIVDTAGRLHIDEALMEELKQIHETVNPDEVLLVVDAMTGQDAVNVAESFNQQLALTGVVLTKLDGDTRGGAALSVKAVTGCPIKFAALGEKIDALEPFHPERMASRILGMGDMLSLIEKAQANIDADKAKEMEMKMRNAAFTFDDFLEQMQQVKQLGPIDQILDMIPGMNKMKQTANLKVDERQMGRIEAIVRSMTNEERQDPDLINHSRRKRIAAGSGTSLADVNRLIKQFDEMRRMMKQFTEMMGPKGPKMMKNLKSKAGKGMRFPFR